MLVLPINEYPTRTNKSGAGKPDHVLERLRGGEGDGADNLQPEKPEARPKMCHISMILDEEEGCSGGCSGGCVFMKPLILSEPRKETVFTNSHLYMLTLFFRKLSREI